MAVLNSIMVPHPPLIIPEVGRGTEKAIQNTIDAYGQAARFIFGQKPDTIVVVTPHSVMYKDWFHISPGSSASGSFAQFRAGGVVIEARYDEQFVNEICRAAKEAGFPAGTQGEGSSALDHATMIPLYFVREAYGETPLPPIVRVGLSGLSLEEHYRLGMLIRDTAGAMGCGISVIASGDLSHRLKEDGPYGFRAEGPEYDQKIMDVMGRAAFGELLEFPEHLCEAAAECGHRAFAVMAGCFDGAAVKPQALSYEGPFGVGYGVCLFEPMERTEQREFLKAKPEDEYVGLARLSVETYVKTGQRAQLPKGLSGELTNRRAGAFVSLHIGGRLRGCIGTISPTTNSVAQEILQNGVSACSSDPRFPPVTPQELPSLEYSVDVLGEAETIDSKDMLDIKRYGVIVSNGFRRGLLLPDLDGVNSVDEQIAIARRKAGLGANEPIKLQRFEVVRHG